MSGAALGRMLALACVLIAIVSLLVCAPAFGAGTWSVPTTIDAGAALEGVSCSSPSWCLAVDDLGRALYWNGHTWSAPAVIDSGAAQSAASSPSCVSQSYCAAVVNPGGYEGVWIYSGGTWTSAPDPGFSVGAVGCGSTHLCVAGGGNSCGFLCAEPHAAVYDGSAWSAEISPNNEETFRAVSCLSTGFCLLVAAPGLDGTSDYYTYGAGSWQDGGALLGGGATGVSCESPLFCVAADSNRGATFVYNGTAFTHEDDIDSQHGSFPFNVTCPSAAFCVAADTSGNTFLFNGSSWSGPVTTTGSGGVSCPSLAFCMAVGGTQAQTYTANPGAQAWGTRFASPNPDSATAEAYSPDGARLFVTGTSGAGMLTIAYNAATGVSLWSRNFTLAGAVNQGKAVAVSPDGSTVFVTGQTQTGSQVDYVTVAYDGATGNRLWLQQFDSTAHSTDSPVAIATDGTRVYVAGSSVGAASGKDYATIAYDPATGARLWVQRFNSMFNRDDAPSAVALNPDGSKLYVTGTSNSTSTGDDYATVAYDTATGNRLWVQRFDGPVHGIDDATAIGISLDEAHLFVTGESQAAGGFQAATVAYNASSGALLWSRRFGKATIGASGTPALAVNAFGTLSPGRPEVVVADSVAGTSSNDYGTVAYTADGTQLWSATYNGPAGNEDNPTAIATSSDGSRVVVTGKSIGSGTGQDVATLAYDLYSGRWLWTRRFDAVAHLDDIPAAIALAPDSSRVAVAGSSGGGGTGLDWSVTDYASG
jgi:hypothetical protein